MRFPTFLPALATLATATLVAPGVELRILPLGDSITYGYTSSDGNGYRLQLQQDLSGSAQNFIGSVMSGTMTDNDNEGHNGATISEIGQFAQASLPERPNVVLLHAGTNDFLRSPPSEDPYQAPTRLGALIDEILTTCPDATVLVAQIINTANANAEQLVQEYDNAVPGVVAARANEGYKVAVVDFRSITADMLVDGVHPTDAAYDTMGNIWFNAIANAANEGWITPPVGPDPA